MNPTDALPETWRWTRMKFLKSRPFQYGANEAADIEDPDLPRFVRITDVRADGTLRDDTFKSLPEEIAAPYTLDEGDILFARSGATVGKAFMYRNDWGRCCFAGYLIRLRPDLKRIIPTFLSYFTQTKNYSDEIAASTIQATIQNVSAERYGEFQVPTPPIPEQRAIAAFLDRKTAQIDAVVARKQRLIERLQEKRQALISHAVTKGLNPHAPMKDSGIEWLGQIPAHWSCRRIATFSDKITNGYVGPTRDLFVEDGVRYLQSLHIKNNSIRFTPPYHVPQEWHQQHAKSILRRGDVLVVQTGDIGQVASVPAEYEGANCHALIIVQPRSEECSGRYLSWVLNSHYGYHSLKSIQTGALHPHLNCTFVREVFVPLPPRDEQDHLVDVIERRLSCLDRVRQLNQEQITKLQEYRQTLISAAVTGKIDVTKEAAC